MKNFAIYQKSDNVIKFIESRQDDTLPIVDFIYEFVEIADPVLTIDQYYIDGGKLKIRPPQPSPFYDWNGIEWVLNDAFWYDNQAELVRGQRDELLLQSDWTDTASAPTRLGTDVYNSWQVYRQQLRDVPEQSGFPLNVAWPTKPS